MNSEVLEKWREEIVQAKFVNQVHAWDAKSAALELFAECERLEEELVALADQQKVAVNWAKDSDLKLARARYEIDNQKERTKKVLAELAEIKARTCRTCGRQHPCVNDPKWAHCRRSGSVNPVGWTCGGWEPREAKP